MSEGMNEGMIQGLDKVVEEKRKEEWMKQRMNGGIKK